MAAFYPDVTDVRAAGSRFHPFQNLMANEEQIGLAMSQYISRDTSQEDSLYQTLSLRPHDNDGDVLLSCGLLDRLGYAASIYHTYV